MRYVILLLLTIFLSGCLNGSTWFNYENKSANKTIEYERTEEGVKGSYDSETGNIKVEHKKDIEEE